MSMMDGVNREPIWSITKNTCNAFAKFGASSAGIFVTMAGSMSALLHHRQAATMLLPMTLRLL
jgi:hypothetical protein